MSSTKFKEDAPDGGFANGYTPKEFADEPLMVVPKSLTALDGSAIDGVTLNNAESNLTEGEVVIASAAFGKGMGRFDIDFNEDALKLVLMNSKAYVDRINYPNEPTPYTSTITLKLQSTP